MPDTHRAVITDVAVDAFTLTIWRSDDASVFSDLVWLYGRPLLDAATDRLNLAGWWLASPWREDGQEWTAEVGAREGMTE